VGLGACSPQPKAAPPTAAAPPPPPPPLPPPPPSADDVLQKQLVQLGAVQNTDGWTLPIATAKFKGTKASFDADDQAKLDQVGTLMKSTPHLRIVVENHAAAKGSKAHTHSHGHQQEESQLHANAVLRDLTAAGADEDRIQAVGTVVATTNAAAQAKPANQANAGIDLRFSNAEGEFPPPAASATAAAAPSG
jgi:outer membrane protein OmpA-like peptidoglycan-associated protein